MRIVKADRVVSHTLFQQHATVNVLLGDRWISALEMGPPYLGTEQRIAASCVLVSELVSGEDLLVWFFDHDVELELYG